MFVCLHERTFVLQSAVLIPGNARLFPLPKHASLSTSTPQQRRLASLPSSLSLSHSHSLSLSLPSPLTSHLVTSHHISPHALTTTSRFGTSFPRYPVFVISILRTTSMPASSYTFPNTTCLPSRNGVGTVVMKNCDPLPFGPAFAIDSSPAVVCFSVKFSSANVFVP